MKFDQIIELKTSVESLFRTDLWLDFEVLSYTSIGDGLLTIAASRDFSYYHNIEIRMSGVTYFCGPLSWGSSPNTDGILVPDCDDAGQQLIDVTSSNEIAIRFLNDDNRRIVVLANSASLNIDTVFYYDKSPLAANERIADWVPR